MGIESAGRAGLLFFVVLSVKFVLMDLTTVCASPDQNK